MAETSPGLTLIEGMLNGLIERTNAQEVSIDDLPRMQLCTPDGEDAGYVRVWRTSAESAVDRIVHVQLLAGPVRTQLLFAFADERSPVPHYHAQTVEFPPDGCVYNVDFMPRLDAVEHPAYFTDVFSGLTKPYLKATTKPENSCSKALMNPTIAPFLSPWGIVSHRTDAAELERVKPFLEAYLDHYLYLVDELTYAAASTDTLVHRHRKHLERFFDDDLDPRAWRGVYNLVGDSVGQQIKHVLKTSLRN